MSTFFAFRSASPSGRERHISNLKSRCQSVQEKNANVYEVPVNQQYIMRIVLPAHFPNELPHLQILPPTLSSRYVDPTGKVVSGANELLRSWNPQNPNCVLGDIVVDILQKLRTDCGSNNPSASRYPHMGSYNSGTVPVNYSPNSTVVNSSPISTPIQSHSYGSQEQKRETTHVSFPEIEGLSSQRIQQLLDNEQAFEDFFRETNCVRMLEVARDESRKKNQERAQKNLDKESRIKEENARLSGVTKQLNELRLKYEKLSTQQAELMSQYSPSVIKEKLSIATDEAEEESENIINEYKDGDISISSFIDQYFEKRKIYHARKAKLECVS